MLQIIWISIWVPNKNALFRLWPFSRAFRTVFITTCRSKFQISNLKKINGANTSNRVCLLISSGRLPGVPSEIGVIFCHDNWFHQRIQFPPSPMHLHFTREKKKRISNHLPETSCHSLGGADDQRRGNKIPSSSRFHGASSHDKIRAKTTKTNVPQTITFLKRCVSVEDRDKS